VQVREAVLRADYYLPSRAEFLQTWGVSDAEEGLRKLAKEATTLCVILKDGAQGAHYVDKGKLITVPAQRVNSANNASGAGDSFNAGFLSGLLSGEDLRGAVEGGCKVAAEHISKS
jgi:sugar/nucleoside kinase (ribokinase family)